MTEEQKHDATVSGTGRLSPIGSEMGRPQTRALRAVGTCVIRTVVVGVGHAVTAAAPSKDT